jgi:hypothetical protein
MEGKTMEFWEKIQEFVKPFPVTCYSILVCLKDDTQETAMTFGRWQGTFLHNDPIFFKKEVSLDPKNVAFFIPLQHLNELKDKLIAACEALTTPEKIRFKVYF